MNYQELRVEAKKNIGPYCKCCSVCDGRACSNKIPGPGAKGTGTVAIRNYNAWQDVDVVMDTISSNTNPDTTCNLFGHEFDLPVFVAPVGAISTHYSDYMDTISYSKAVLNGASSSGSLAFVGDGLDPKILEEEAELIGECGGIGIPTIKPWDMDTIASKIEMVKQYNPVAIAMDIDAAGLPFLQGQTPAADPKTVMQLSEIVDMCDGTPFILKGVMSLSGAFKACEAGVTSIVVSNHGGRVLDGTPATASVLPAIARAVGDEVDVLVDGGIRSGVDVYRALTLGAKGCLVARPFVVAAFGGDECGVADYMTQLKAELRQTMLMCGKKTVR